MSGTGHPPVPPTPVHLLAAVVGELDAGGSTGFDEQVHEALRALRPHVDALVLVDFDVPVLAHGSDAQIADAGNDDKEKLATHVAPTGEGPWILAWCLGAAWLAAGPPCA